MNARSPESSGGSIDILIRCGPLVLPAWLNTSPCAREVAAVLPVDSEAGRFGDELFFEIPPISRLSAEARQEVEIGDIAYWPPGRSFCIFWGPTPASTATRIRAASSVNLIGRVTGDPGLLSTVREGDLIRVEKA